MEDQWQSESIDENLTNREDIIASHDSIINDSFDKIDASSGISQNQPVVVTQAFINELETPQKGDNIFDSKICDLPSSLQLSQLLQIGTQILVNISSFNILFDNEDHLHTSNDHTSDNYLLSEVWVKAVIQNILNDNEIFKNDYTPYAPLTYMVKVIDVDFLKLSSIANSLTFKVNITNIAVTLDSRFLYNLPVGSRILLKHPHIYDNNSINNNQQGITNLPNCQLYQLKSGTILEPICASNSYRYLIIFGDWISLYLDPTLGGTYDHGTSVVHLNYVNDTTITKINTVYLEEQLPPSLYSSSRSEAVTAFIHNYLTRYPERQLVHLNKGQTVNLLIRDYTVQAFVIDTDCSLVKLKVEPSSTLAHSDFHMGEFCIYLGSFILEPIYKAMMRQTSALLNQKMHCLLKDVPIDNNFISPSSLTTTAAVQQHQEIISSHSTSIDECNDDSPIIIAENDDEDDDTPIVLNTISSSTNTTALKMGAVPGSTCEIIYDSLPNYQHQIKPANNVNSHSSIKQPSQLSCKKVLEATKSYNLVRCDITCRRALLNQEKLALQVCFSADHFNGFAKPIYAGWGRFCVTESGEIYDGKNIDGLNNTTRIVYLSPLCNNSSHKRSVLTNARAILGYFIKTKLYTLSYVTVDYFSFDPRVSPNLKPLSALVPRKISTIPPYEPSLDGTYLLSWDIADGKESTPISCVLDAHYVDKMSLKTALQFEKPPHFCYDSKRKPAPGIVINEEDASFLVGCTCTDGFCGDPNICSCRSLTITSFKQYELDNFDFDSTDESEGSVVLSNESPASILNRQNNRCHEYNFKRLPRKILSGIYECNVNCLCHHRHCLNRVVQNGLGGARMQIFKDEYKGWCGRTLDDIPKGAFVSTYVGYILSEDMSNMIGTDADEYFSLLDFIEVNEQQHIVIGDDSFKPITENLIHSNDDNLSNQRHKFKRTNINLFETARKQQSPDKNEYELIDIIDLEEEITNYDSDDIEILHEFNVQPCNNRTIKVTAGENVIQKLLTNPLPSYFSENKDISNSNNSNNPHNVNETSSNLKLTNTTRYWCSNQNDVFIIDAKQKGNIGRFFSHSCDPNMFVQNVFVDTHNLCFPWVCFFASRTIKAGEELTWDYCYEINSTGKTIFCMCMSKNCRGRLL